MANVNGIGWYAGWIPDGGSSSVSDSNKASSADFSDQLSNSIANSSEPASTRSKTASSVGNSTVSEQNSTSARGSSKIPATNGSSDPSGDSDPTAGPGIESEADAYWAMQPPAVRALRSMTNPAEREAAAVDLAHQGYTIDYQTMVLGWDPLNVMSIRQFYGYTWVPSMLQPPISGMPGSNLPGLPVYDPSNPPAGSIQVSTDFAIGKTVPSWESYNAVTTPGGNPSNKMLNS